MFVRRPSLLEMSALFIMNEAEESDETEDEATGERTTRVGRPTSGRGGMKVAARIGEDCEER